MINLELDRVCFNYPGSATPVLEGISCTVSDAELIVISGANGSGKSTLARLIAGLIEPNSGVIRRRREESNGWNGVALVMQEPSSQMLAASVADEIAWGLENLRLSQAEIEQKVETALEQFGLTHLQDTHPEALADGECQLTAFAANYVMEPDILILDEAAAYLDLKWRKRLWDAARSASKRCGVIWITTRDHDLAGISSVWRLENGKMKVN